MRTSHTAIRRLISNVKNKLTPEQIFASPQFAAYLTDISEGTTKRYRRKSKVITYWDDSDNADIAHTNNRTITINAGNFLTRSFPTIPLTAGGFIPMNRRIYLRSRNRALLPFWKRLKRRTRQSSMQSPALHTIW